MSVPLVGQFENIGDIILRRQLAHWLVPAGRLNVYVGPAPASYTEGLELPSDALIHSDLGSWMRSIVTAPKGSSFAFMPGEVVLSRDHIRDHLGVLPAVAVVKARGGAVIRVGEGVRAGSKLAALMRPSVAAADVVAWRDEFTRSLFGRGAVMPDLAFAEGSSEADLRARAVQGQRRLLVVSLRGDRPAQNSVWSLAVRQAAEQLRLRIVAVSQVRMDALAANRWAAELGGDVLAWDATSDAVQEQRLRSVYAQASVVLSDRLHVLIAAATEGAVPLGLTAGAQQRKVERSFSAAGMPGVGLDCVGWEVDQIRERIIAATADADPMVERVMAARKQLDAIRDEVWTALGCMI